MNKSVRRHWVPGIRLLLCLLLVATPLIAHAQAGAFDGEWYSPQLHYAFRIEGTTGVATQTNSPAFRPGDVILRISSLSERSFAAQQIYTDGVFRAITANLTDADHFTISGPAGPWQMVRRAPAAQAAAPATAAAAQSASATQSAGVTQSAGAPQPAERQWASGGPAWLAEMPRPAEVLRKMRNGNALDTGARQAAAFDRLSDMLMNRAGVIDIRGLSRPMLDVDQAYRRASKRVVDGLSKDWDPACVATNCPARQFNSKVLETDGGALEQDLLKTFFSPRWQADYAQVMKDQQARIAASRPPPPPAISSATEDKLLIGFWVVVVVLVIWVGIKLLKRAAARERARVAAARQPDLDAWQKLGATAAERERTINAMFDAKSGTIGFGTRYGFDFQEAFQDENQTGTQYRAVSCFLQFRISRNLAAMDNREREFLRTTYLLYNAGLIDESQWRHLTFCFVYGEGKALVHEFAYKAPPTAPIKDGPSLLRYYKEKRDASVDSAVSALLTITEQLAQQPNAPAMAQEIGKRMRGGSAWFGADDVHDSIFAGDSRFGVRLGTLEGGTVPLRYTGEGSMITIAPPGSGKTQCFVLPNLLSWPGPAVVLDVKGEIYAGTSQWRAKNVGPVFKFSPLDPTSSASFNPPTFIRQDADYIWEDARFLADMMIVPSGASDPFWENSARDVLTAAIAYLCQQFPPEQRPMSKLMDIVYGIGWDAMVNGLKTNLMVNAMRQMGQSLADMERKQRDSVLKTAQSSLSAWQGERLGRVTRKSDWNPVDLRTSNATVYICINPNEIDSYLSVLRVVIALHIRMLTSQLPARDASPVLFVLDELPRLKKMPPIDEALNIGRQYGIRLWMFAQSYGQLKESYPNAEGMLGSCAVRTFMNVPLNDELAQKLSDQLGYRDGPLDNTRVKLVEPLELAGPGYRDITIVVAANTKPAKLLKSFAYRDPELTARMGSAS